MMEANPPEYGADFVTRAAEAIELVKAVNHPGFRLHLDTGCMTLANDPVAAWGGVKLLREKFGIEPAVVTGPATDNQVGVDIIAEQMGVSAFNAITSGAALGDRVIVAAGLAERFPIKPTTE